MRTIKFRGKTNSGKWIYSDGILQADILDEGGTIETVQLWEDGEGWTYVEPFTIGQFTGRKDGNNEEIYESDIVEVIDKSTPAESTLKGVIIYCDVDMAFDLQIDKDSIMQFDIDHLKNIEILGNIFDNKELLGWLK